MNNIEKFLELYRKRAGLFNGCLIGLFVGILLLTIGFFKTLLLGICIGVGALFGTHKGLGMRLGKAIVALVKRMFQKEE